MSHLGPGLIISAAIVGSGELIVTPKVGAASGFTLLWFIILACIVKVFVQIELARVAIFERVTTLEALNSIPGPRLRVSWVVWFWLFMYFGLVFQVAGLIGGCVLVFQTMGLTLSPETLLVIVAGSGALLLVTGRYKTVEVGSTAMVAMFTLSTIVAMITLQWTPYRVTSANLIEGLRFQLPASFTVAFAAFGITGVGASELIYYPYWCLEKGYARHVGPREDSPEWVRRARGWLRVLHADATLSLVIYTGCDRRVLHPRSSHPSLAGAPGHRPRADRDVEPDVPADSRRCRSMDFSHRRLCRLVFDVFRGDGLQRAPFRRRCGTVWIDALSRGDSTPARHPHGVCRPARGVSTRLFSVSSARRLSC